MKTITLRVEPDTLEALDEEADERDMARSEYVRELFRTRDEADRLRAERDRMQAERERMQAEYEQEIKELENQISELRSQLQARNAREDDVTELAEYVREERELQKQRARRRQHNMFRRAWWWMAGEPEPDEA